LIQLEAWLAWPGLVGLIGLHFDTGIGRDEGEEEEEEEEEDDDDDDELMRATHPHFKRQIHVGQFRFNTNRARERGGQERVQQ
jgi:hypothetical protein